MRRTPFEIVNTKIAVLQEYINGVDHMGRKVEYGMPRDMIDSMRDTVEILSVILDEIEANQ